jgi:hypothetical protein
MKFMPDKQRLRLRLEASKLLLSAALMSTFESFAQQELVFRSHDFRLGFFYEVRGSALYVYRDRASRYSKLM